MRRPSSVSRFTLNLVFVHRQQVDIDVRHSVKCVVKLEREIKPCFCTLHRQQVDIDYVDSFCVVAVQDCRNLTLFFFSSFSVRTKFLLDGIKFILTDIKGLST